MLTGLAAVWLANLYAFRASTTIARPCDSHWTARVPSPESC